MFRVPPFLTKLEIRDYLEKIYEMDVMKVNTAIFLGRVKKVNGYAFRTKTKKVAYVTVRNPPVLTPITSKSGLLNPLPEPNLQKEASKDNPGSEKKSFWKLF